MVSKSVNNFTPAVAIPPGETIRENMVYLGMNQEELAARLGITAKHLSNIINGLAPITHDSAIKLESVIGPSAEFWMELESNYQLNKIRLDKQNELAASVSALKMIPYKEMARYAWVELADDKLKMVEVLKNFFGVGHLNLIQNTYHVAYRKHKQINTISDYALLAWLRKVELEGLNIETNKYSKRKLKSAIPLLRSLTLESLADAYQKIQALCAECGVAVVLVEYLSKTYVCGANIWRGDKPVIAVSDRGKRSDIFWFSFFHEIAHLLNTRNKEAHICFEGQEEEMDRLAGSILISDKLYEKFLKEYNYENIKEIVDYAGKIGVAPFILIGRLLHDGYIDYQQRRDLIPPFDIRAIKSA
jgi:HTH-type transcriptional regulator / antitoxin HigA